MGRDRDLEVKTRKVHGRIERDLQRGDPEAAVDGLLSLPAAARAELCADVARLLRASAPEQRRQGAWGRLHRLAARVESEPRLLGNAPAASPAPDRASDELRWAFLLACLHARDWVRATRFLVALGPMLESRSPALQQTLAAWIESRGDLDAEKLPSLGAPGLEPPPTDPRLGYDGPARKRAAAPAPPTAVGEVEGQVLKLAATQPFASFAETVLEWQRRSAPELSGALARAAAPLAVREILLALERQASPAPPALLLGRLARGRGHPYDDHDRSCEGELLLGVRLALPALAREPIARPVGSALHELAAAASQVPEAQAFVVEWLVEWLTASEPGPGKLATGLAVAEGLLGRAAGSGTLASEPRLRVWAAALLAWDREHARQDTQDTVQPPWLRSITEKVREDAPALGTFLGSLPRERRRPLLVGIVADAPIQVATSALAACWDGADEDRRQELAPLVAGLMNRAQDETSDEDLLEIRGDRSLFERMVRAFESGGQGLPPLVGAARTVWRRLGQRAASYDPGLLSWALSDAADPPAARRSVAAYLERRTDVEAYLEAMRSLAETERLEFSSLSGELERRMLSHFAGEPASLARALKWLRGRDAPRGLILNTAQALLAAVARHPPPSPAPAWLEEVKLAQSLCGKKPRGKGRGKKAGQKAGQKTDKNRAAREPSSEAVAKRTAGKAKPDGGGPAADRGKNRTAARAATRPPDASARQDPEPKQLGLPLGDRAT